MDLNEYDLIKGNGFNSEFDKEKIRETFISRYCKKRGWNESDLKEEQLNEIKKQKEYLNPGLILG